MHPFLGLQLDQLTKAHGMEERTVAVRDFDAMAPRHWSTRQDCLRDQLSRAPNSAGPGSVEVRQLDAFWIYGPGVVGDVEKKRDISYPQSRSA